MKVVVSPASNINARLSHQTQQFVHGTSTFVGSANVDTKVQDALNTANAALIVANNALSQVNSKYSANGGLLSGDMAITGNIIPTVSDHFTLGNSQFPFESLYVGPGTVYVDGIAISNTNGSLTISNTTTFTVEGDIQTGGTIFGSIAVVDGGDY
jgi:hypothetical protein